jgi:hypothetical protein
MSLAAAASTSSTIEGLSRASKLALLSTDGDKQVRIFGDDIAVRASIHTLRWQGLAPILTTLPATAPCQPGALSISLCERRDIGQDAHDHGRHAGQQQGSRGHAADVPKAHGSGHDGTDADEYAGDSRDSANPDQH